LTGAGRSAWSWRYGVKVGEQRPLEQLGFGLGPGGVAVQPEGIQPAVFSKRIFEREEFELRGRFFVANSRGLGHLRLAVRDSGALADGPVLGATDGRPFRLAYEVRCDAYWRVRSARVGVPGESLRSAR